MYHQHHWTCQQIEHSLCHTKRWIRLCVFLEVANGALLICFTLKTTLCITSTIHSLYLTAVSIAQFVMRMDIVYPHTHTVELWINVINPLLHFAVHEYSLNIKAKASTSCFFYMFQWKMLLQHSSVTITPHIFVIATCIWSELIIYLLVRCIGRLFLGNRERERERERESTVSILSLHIVSPLLVLFCSYV